MDKGPSAAEIEGVREQTDPDPSWCPAYRVFSFRVQEAAPDVQMIALIAEAIDVMSLTEEEMSAVIVWLTERRRGRPADATAKAVR